MKANKRVLTIAALMGSLVALQGALTYSDLRTALLKWAVGDKVIQDPNIALLDYFNDAKVYVATNVWDPASCATNVAVSTLVTVTGAVPGDPAVAGLTSYAGHADTLLTAQATNDAVRVTFYNKAGAAVDLGEGTVKVIVFKY